MLSMVSAVEFVLTDAERDQLISWSAGRRAGRRGWLFGRGSCWRVLSRVWCMRGWPTSWVWRR